MSGVTASTPATTAIITASTIPAAIAVDFWKDPIKNERMLQVLLLALALQTPDKPKEFMDLHYREGKGADPKKHKLDLYVPPSDKAMPVLMWIHGGDWRAGDRKEQKDLGRAFARVGVACAVISYRLSPKIRHPEHVQDCAQAFAWLHQHAKEYGGDPDRLFVGGHSAGGHLSTLLTLNRKYFDEVRLPEDAVKGVISVSGVYQIALPKEAPSLQKIVTEAFGKDPAAFEEASPVSFVRNAKVPMLVLTETQARKTDGGQGLLDLIRSSMEQFRGEIGKAGWSPGGSTGSSWRNPAGVSRRRSPSCTRETPLEQALLIDTHPGPTYRP